MSSLIGQSLGRYHILEQLGEGGMATVYRAYDTRLESDVAVKVIRTENLAPNILERALKRFEREAKALAKLTHANIVKVLDYGEHEGKPYLVMPYLPGGTLKERLRGKPMQYQEAARLLLPIAKALAFAHQQGMIHRDVKPSNILITESGDPMLTDFGIAKIIDEESTMDLTGTSAAVGTPEYMAPEQVTAKTVDHRVDIYALGVVFYEMVTGQKPFQADTPMAVLFKHASEPLPRPTKYVPTLPAQVENILAKALAKDPNSRHQHMTEFAEDLENLSAISSSKTNRITVSSIGKKPQKNGGINRKKRIESSPKKKFPIKLFFGIGVAVIVVGIVTLAVLTSRFIIQELRMTDSPNAITDQSLSATPTNVTIPLPEFTEWNIYFSSASEAKGCSKHTLVQISLNGDGTFTDSYGAVGNWMMEDDSITFEYPDFVFSGTFSPDGTNIDGGQTCGGYKGNWHANAIKN